MGLVVNPVFAIAKTKYLITFISIYFIQYPCIINNNVVCTPACYDCSDIISLKKMGGGLDLGIDLFTKRF